MQCRYDAGYSLALQDLLHSYIRSTFSPILITAMMFVLKPKVVPDLTGRPSSHVASRWPPHQPAPCAASHPERSEHKPSTAVAWRREANCLENAKGSQSFKYGLIDSKDSRYTEDGNR